MKVHFPEQWGFSGGSDGKEFACNAGDVDSTPGSGKIPIFRTLVLKINKRIHLEFQFKYFYVLSIK